MVARARMGVTMNQLHETYDLLVTPTLPTTAPIAETPYHSQSLHRWNHAVPFTLPFNLTGQPGASIPCGRTEAGLPVGLQIVAARHREDVVLKASRAFEALAPQQWPEPAVEQALLAVAPGGDG
jgi:aspartyl-tRNA(Asn)/glutamyl-tRNA(Gln) amidotransferase subunit A